MTDQSPDACFEGSIQPRYTDLDTWRHVNNSRVYQLHLEARIQYLVNRFGADAWFSDSERLRPRRTLTDFRQVSWYGSPIEFRLTVLSVARDQALLRTDLYQNGQQVGVQTCVLGALLNHEWVDLPQPVHDALRADQRGPAPDLPDAAYTGVAGRLADFPLQRELTLRYADLDADSQRGEAALARFMEQARFGAVNSVDFGEQGILIASVDITFLHYRPGWQPLALSTACSHIGNTSFQLVGAAASEHGLQAIARSVMVMVDEVENRPVPLTDAVRQQLADLTL